MKKTNLPLGIGGPLLTDGYADDFRFDTGAWSDSGTVSISNGICSIVTGSSDNDEAFRKFTDEPLIFSQGKPFNFETSVAFTDSNPDDGAVAIGVVDAAGAGLIADGGAALRSGNIDGCLFVKFKDQDYWTLITQRGGIETRRTAELTIRSKNNLTPSKQGPSAGYQQLSIETIPTATHTYVVFRIDGDPVAKTVVADISSATEMQPVFFVKAGSANAQTLTLDYVQFHQKR